MNNINFTLIDVLDSHKIVYKELHNLLFPNINISFEWINWYFGEIGCGKTRTYGAFCDERLIGIWSVEPRKMYVGGILLSVGRCFAVGIHPNFRRQGLFVDLSKYALREEKKLCEYDYIIGFPETTRAVVGGHLKIGWYIVQEIPEYRLEKSDISDVILRSSATLVTSLLNESLFPQEGVLFGGVGYDALRWLNHPENYYIALSHFSKSGLTGHNFIVLKPYGEICHILDVCGSPTELLQIACGLCKKHNWKALTIWCADNEIYKMNIEKVGFKKTEKAVCVIAYNIRARNSLKLASCHIQNGVEEGY